MNEPPRALGRFAWLLPLAALAIALALMPPDGRDRESLTTVSEILVKRETTFI
jgi:hypothetical protein